MKLSIETSLLTLTGFAMVYLAITGPLADAMYELERAKREECAYKALRAIDLAIATAVGGGSSSSFVHSPCEVEVQGRGRTVTVSSGDRDYKLSYPFEVLASGVVQGESLIKARWINGTVYVEVNSFGG